MKLSNQLIKELLERGFFIYPNVYKDKRPACPHGYKDATNNFEEFVKLVHRTPQFNVAIATGKISDIVVIDIDARNGGIENFKKLTDVHGDDSLKTLTSKTSDNGFHLFFKYPKHFNGSFPKELCIGVDIKADGGGVNGPGSTHPSGHIYNFKDTKAHILEFPEWMMEIISSKTNTPELSTIFTNEGKIPEGQRNNSIHIIGWGLIKQGMPLDQLRLHLHSINRTLSSNPLPFAEIDGIVNSILKKAPLIQLGVKTPSFESEKFYGLAGEFVNTVLPHTEASGVGLYLQFLITFGTMIGKRACINIGATKHHTGEFLLLIGQSARGRKGSSMDIVKYILKNRDPDFFKKNVKSNIVSGEGIVEIIKDQTVEAKIAKKVKGATKWGF